MSTNVNGGRLPGMSTGVTNPAALVAVIDQTRFVIDQQGATVKGPAISVDMIRSLAAFADEVLSLVESIYPNDYGYELVDCDDIRAIAVAHGIENTNRS